MEKIAYKLEHYDGPLDLLLHLIEKDKVDIFDIPIVDITAQYLQYVDQLQEKDLNIISDFLVMAATLLDIKAQMLLPREKDEETGEEIDPRRELVERLLEYKKYKVLSRRLEEREADGDVHFYREKQLPKEVEGFVPPVDIDELLQGVDLESLRCLFEDVMKRKEETLDPIRSGFGVIHREKISIGDKIRDVLEYIREHHRVSFDHLVKKKKNRTEVVVSFLALLELMKMGRVTLRQEQPFGDMEIQESEAADGTEGLDLAAVEEFD